MNTEIPEIKKSQKDYQAEWYLKNAERLRVESRKYYWNNLKQVKASSAAWRAKNKEYLKKSKKAYRQENQKKVTAGIADWCARNREKSRAIKAAWKARNPDRVRMDVQKRYARKCRATVGDTEVILAWEKSWRSKKLVTCYWCSKKISGKTAQSDHINALTKGGTHSVENLCISCSTCNQRKNAKSLSAWNSQIAQPVLL